MQTLISEDDIRKRVTELGDHIGREYAGQPLTILGILTGSVVFLADLIRKIELPLQLGLIQASSYRGKVTTPGELEINLQLMPDLTNRNVILVDDIFDTATERFDLDLTSLPAGDHIVSVRATDAGGNVGSGEAQFTR